MLRIFCFKLCFAWLFGLRLAIGSQDSGGSTSDKRDFDGLRFRVLAFGFIS